MKTIKEIFNNFNIVIDTTQEHLLSIYATSLQEYAKVMNLTTITETDEIYLKHFVDSAMLLNLIDTNTMYNLLDVGTGAGFPGMVIAIMCPKINVSLMEPTSKKCQFLMLIKEKLKLNNVTIINNRSEIYIKEPSVRQSYDFVTSRSVANLTMLLELTIPYLKVNGLFFAYKLTDIKEEINKAESALQVLHSTIINQYDYSLDGINKHSIYVIKKLQSTSNQYPRTFVKIKNTPINEKMKG